MAGFCRWVLRADAWLWAQTNLKRFIVIWLAAMSFSFAAAFAGLIGEDGLILGCLGWPMFWLALAVGWNSLVGHLVIAVGLAARWIPPMSDDGAAK